MFITRKIGALLRGQTTSFQIYSACLPAALIAFNPGFGQAPGLIALLVALLVVLNANLFVAAVAGLIAKLLYLLLLPLLFDLGVWLVEGPLHAPLAFLANAPVTAWFGFEYYVVSPGLLLGGLIGLFFGWLINRQIDAIHRRLGRWEHDSEAFRKWSRKAWVKVFAFVFIGGLQPKKGEWEKLTRKKVGNPIRPLGAALVLLFLVLGFVVLQFFDSLILTQVTRSALERANGATVDLREVSFVPTEGRLTVSGLAMADPNALDQNLFAAETLSADVSGLSLLTRKVALDRLEITDGSAGTPRRVPGSLVGPRPEPAAPPPEAEDANTYSVEEVLARASVWKERLSQLAEWVKRFSPDEKTTEAEDAAPGVRSWRERLEERARTSGYAEIASDQLIRRSPRFAIHEIVANGVKIEGIPGEAVDFRGENISTQPWLAERIPAFSAAARSGTFGLDFRGVGYTSGGGANEISYFYHGLPADALAGLLREPEQFPVKEGTFSIEGTGSQEGIAIELPLNVTLNNGRIAIASLDPIEVDGMEIPAAIGGTLSAPTLTVDPSAFQNALQAAAKERISGEVRGRLNEALGEDKTESLRRILPFSRENGEE